MRPNFLLLMTDQHRADHLGCYGNPILATPHIDGIARRGIAFDRFHVAAPASMPNRASLLTGRMPSVHGVRHDGMPLSLETTNVVDLLRAAGWRTAMIGKSHLQTRLAGPPPPDPRDPGLQRPPPGLDDARPPPRGRYDQEIADLWRNNPERVIDLPYYGFDKVDLAIGHGDQVEGHYTAWLERRAHDPAGLRGPDHALPSPGLACPLAWRTAIPEELYPTSFVAERTIARLEAFAATRERPFFLACSFPDPHCPFTPPGRYFDRYRPGDMALPDSFAIDRGRAPSTLARLLDQRDAGARVVDGSAPFACNGREAREAIALAFGMITMVDDAIGRILKSLDSLGLGESTIVIFTTDHGDYMGDHQLLLKGPLHFDSLTRVPFVWADPQATGAGSRRTALAGTIDVAPTILERAGLAPFNGIQGRSLCGVLAGVDAHRDALLIEDEVPRDAQGVTPRVRTLLTGRHRLSLTAHAPGGELYDRQEDPCERINRWDDPDAAAVLRALQERLLREIIELTDTSPGAVAPA